MENNYEHFDKHIRAKLENLEVPGAPEGWELLSEKIDADPALNPSVEASDPIDQVIKSKLESNQASYDPAFWSLMEKRIEADVDLSVPQLDDVAFDGVMYENLNRYQVPYNAGHWELMAKRIREEFSLQTKLYRYKVVELSLMVLAIFTFFQFYPGKNANQYHQPPQAAIIAPTPAETQVNDQSTTTLSSAANILQQDATRQAEQSADNASANQAAAKQTPPTLLATAEKPTAREKATIVADQVGQATNPYLLPELEIRSQTGTGFPAQSLSPALTEGAKEQEQNKPPLIAEAAIPPASPLVELLALQTTPMEALTYTGENNLPACVLCSHKQKLVFQLGMMTSMDLNYVMTPYDEKFEEASYGQLTTGYTGGLIFGMSRGKWGLNTGIIYSSKHYEPKSNFELSGSLLEGYTGEGFKAAQLNILSVPLNAHYTFDGSGKWQWYALAGMSAKFATNNNFDVKTFPVGSRAALSAPNPRNPTEESDDEEEEETYYGILEGGNLKSNLFMTANVGFGMERYVSPRWSVILQPTYQHYFYTKGLGPNDDRFHSLSLFLGVRAKLNSNIK